MRKIFLIIGFMLLCSFVIAEVPYYESSEDSSNSAPSESSNYVVTMVRYEPYPVNPGEYFRIWIQLKRYSSVKRDVDFTFIESYPFSLDEGVNPTRSFSDLESESILLEYKIRVANDAVPGENTLVFKETLSSGNSIKHEFDIYIQDVETSFDAVVQDYSDGELAIALANTGQNDALATIVKIPTQDNIKVTGSKGQMIGNLEQGDYTIVSFEVTGKSEVVTLEIDYTDAIGMRRQEYIDVDFSEEGSTSTSFSDRNFSNIEGGMNSGFGPGTSDTTSGFFSTKTLIYAGAVILVLVLIFIWYKKRKHKSPKEKTTPDWMKAKKGK